MKRKVAGGSRSWEGFRRTATLLSAIESCRASGRSAIEPMVVPKDIDRALTILEIFRFRKDLSAHF